MLQKHFAVFSKYNTWLFHAVFEVCKIMLCPSGLYFENKNELKAPPQFCNDTEEVLINYLKMSLADILKLKQEGAVK